MHFTFIKQFVHVFDRTIGLMSTVFANGQEERGSIPGRVIPKTQKKKKMALDASLRNT